MRVNIILPMAQKDAGNQLAKSITENEADLLTFGGVRLSADGQEPATHTGCSTYMSESYRDELPALAAQVEGLCYTATESWDQLLAEQGLQTIVSPMDIPA